MRLWLPLALSFTLMLQSPTVQAAVARLRDGQRNLAAFGLMFAFLIDVQHLS